MPLTEITNFLALSDTLYTSGQPTEAQFTELAQAGIQVVINLALSTSDTALKDEPATAKALGMEHVHLPVEWGNPTTEDLQRFFDAMDAHQGKKMLVHCAMNYRATAFTALWRVKRQGWEIVQAFEFQKRVWNLDEYPIWKNFIERALKE